MFANRAAGPYVALALLLSLGLHCSAREPSVHYHISHRVGGPDGLWDYASVDEQSRRLLVGRQGGVLALDLDKPGVASQIFASPVVHQVLPIGHGLLLATTGESNSLAILQDRPPTLLARVAVTGNDPDSVAYDRKTALAATFNRGSRDVTLIDPAKATVVGSFTLPGAPEFSVADGNGIVYVNIADKAEIAVLDLGLRKVVREIPLTGCREPTGLALDPQTHLLLSACDNGVAKFVTPQGREVATLAIGEAPDAAFIDVRRRLAFIPSGGSGTLAVISIADAERISLVQTLKTQPGTRTGAVDPQTGFVYLPAGRLTPPVAPAKWPSVAPGSFEIMIVAP
jgi:DNA-binding beta-propeller fold protein YncE